MKTQHVILRCFNTFVFLCGLVYAIAALAQQKPENLEPLPTDPKKRIFYGEHYNPERYAKCREEWIKSDGDPRIDGCLIYKERLEPLNPARRDQFGEFYDPKRYHECRERVSKNDMQCEYLKLRRNVAPEYWPYPNIAKPQLPEAPNPPIYRRGMKPKEYFDALCKAEAGEFIYRTVENVEGIYQIRPRPRADDYTLRDRYVMEDPYDYSESEAERPFARYLGAGQYGFFESPVIAAPLPTIDRKYYHDSFFERASLDAQITRYVHAPAEKGGKLWGEIRREFAKTIRSRYGYTWREIRRPMDRQLGVVGGELIVVDLATNELMGLRRGFAYSGYVRNTRSGFQWEIATMCPSKPNWTGGDLAPLFILKVLKPVMPQGGKNAAERK